jgi:hypothetical protein
MSQMPPTPVPPGQGPLPPLIPLPPPKKSSGARFWLVVLILAAIAGGVYFAFFRGDPNEATSDLKAEVIKFIKERDGTEIKSLTLKHDDHVGDRPGQGYSGTATLGDGQSAKVEVWVEHFFNAQGGGDVIHWSMRKGASPTTTGPSQ